VHHLISDDLPRVEGHAMLADLAAAHVNPFRAGPADPSRRVTLDQATYLFDDVVLTECEYDNYRSGSTRRQARANSEYLRLSFIGPGHAIEQLDRQVVGSRASLIVTWSMDPMAGIVTHRTNTVTLTVPLGRLGLPHLFLRDLLATDIGGSPLSGLLHRHARDLIALGAIEQESAHALAQPTVDLIRAALISLTSDDSLMREPRAVTLGHRMRLFLRQHVHDPDLSADVIASRFGVSRRTVYTVLRQEGISLGDWIRSERLRSAAEWLRSSSHDSASIGAIARLAGFADQSTFARAFRAEQGSTPSEYRRLHGPGTDA
jgi:AraC-like DNA-binding protein